VEKPVFWGSETGCRWATTFVGPDGGEDAVYKLRVIPQVLTLQGQNSFPDAFFLHSSGKAGETPIQTADSDVK